MIVCRHCNERYEGFEPSFCGSCGADLRAQSTPGAAANSSDNLSSLTPRPDPLLGRVIGGRYRVLARLGSGGMGVVYKVEHAAMGKMAALKMLHPTLSADREVVKRFRTEARAVSLLTHPNTVQVFDFGESDGSLYMVMELVRGEDLASLVRREGPLPWRRAAPLLLQICEALAEAHEAGIVHRDIKPENLFVVRTREGRETVKVLDFGLAKLRERGVPDNQISTARGTVVGTPYYMSPEQIRGEELDARSDIYSLGATAYDLLTGEHPFDGPSPVQVLAAHLTQRLIPLDERRPDLHIDPEVGRLIARCMARDPADRFATADELRREIERLMGTAGPAPGRRDPTGPVRRNLSLPQVPALVREDFDRFERGLRRRRWVGVTLLLGLLLGGLGAGGWLLLRSEVEVPVTEEVEPNNEAGHANLIATGTPVRGHIGKRLGVETSDRDFFRFQVAQGPAVARISSTGLPNMELHLSVWSALGDRLAENDAGGSGEPELIPNLRLERGTYYAELREEWVAGGMATENVTDWYTLRVDLHPLGPDEEAEPDDTPATALPVALARPYTGYLGRVGDLDFYYPQGEAGGTLEGSVSAIPGVDIRVVALPPGTLGTGDPAGLPGARVFDSSGLGGPEAFSGVPWPKVGGAPLVVVVRKEQPAARAAVRRVGAPGIDVPYTLLLNRREARPGPTPAPH